MLCNIGHLFFKCDEMRLSSAFYRGFEIVFNGARSPQTGLAGGGSRRKGLNKILSSFSRYVLTWPSGDDVARRVGGPEFDSGRNTRFFIFSSLLFFLFF